MAEQNSSGKGRRGNGGNDASAVADKDGGAGTGAALPLFYGNPRPLDANLHKGWGLREQSNYGFATKAGAIPLNAIEFPLAQRHYPIVFAEQAPHLPVAICGIGGTVNGFVDDADAWESFTYVPAYVRRYPFILMEHPEQKQFILCFDADSEVVAADGTRRLFDETGTATGLTNQAMEFCRAFHAQHDATRQFIAALAEHDLLVADTRELKVAADRKVELKGYRIVDRARFDALPDDVFLDWRRRGWLTLLYAHIMSDSNWAGGIQRTARRAAPTTQS